MKTESPTTDEIRAARARRNLSRTEAADLVHAAASSWLKWENGEREMHPAFWELFLLKAHLIPLAEPEKRRIRLPDETH
jgi:putative transcriptional regulator